MIVIGTELEPVELVLTKGRDFRWGYENLDANNNLTPFPAGDLYLEIATPGAQNAEQTIVIEDAGGGTYTLAVGGGTPTSAIAYNSAEAVVQERLEALAEIGAGNVQVTGSYIPQWIFYVEWTQALALSPAVIQAFNTVLSTVFAGLEWFIDLFGPTVDIDGEYTATTFTTRVTAQVPALEAEWITFLTEALESVLDAALGSVEIFTGNIGNITEVYAPTRRFKVEFVGDLADTPITTLVGNGASLTGVTPEIGVTVDQVGRSPFVLWYFTIDGSAATIKVESTEVDRILPRSRYQLVFLPASEGAGGDPVARGRVTVQE